MTKVQRRISNDEYPATKIGGIFVVGSSSLDLRPSLDLRRRIFIIQIFVLAFDSVLFSLLTICTNYFYFRC